VRPCHGLVQERHITFFQPLGAHHLIAQAGLNVVSSQRVGCRGAIVMELIRWNLVAARRVPRVAVMSFLSFAFVGCGGRVSTPVDAPRVEEPAKLLLDVVSDTEARVVAVIEHKLWVQPSPGGEALASQMAQARAGYIVLPSATAQTGTAVEGLLQGKLRNNCGELYTALSAPPPFGFAVCGAASPVRFVALAAVHAGARERDAVIEIVKAASDIVIAPAIEAAYSVDLDGNGLPEVILQATHPDLQTDFADYRPEYYSLIVVLPDREEGRPVYAGYVQAASPKGGFEVFALDAVADVDSDGVLELLVRVTCRRSGDVHVGARTLG
jgi:hypothetical protein